MKLFKILLITFVCILPPCFALKQCTGQGVETQKSVYTEGNITNREAITHPGGSSSNGYVEYVLTLDNKVVKTVDKQTYMTSNVGENIRLVGTESINSPESTFYTLMVILTFIECIALLGWSLWWLINAE